MVRQTTNTPSMAKYEWRINAYEMELEQLKKDNAKMQNVITHLKSLIQKQIY